MDVETLPLLRRILAGLCGTALGLQVMAVVGHADELPTGCSALGLVIHGPSETLRDFCRAEDGALWLTLPDGARFELVTSTSDPSIANPGDGSFHPFDEAVVRAALSGIRYPLAGVSAEVFLLPFPRRAGLQSAAGTGLILLSPGVVPLTLEQQHAELTHELGHVIQYGAMPDGASELWSRYRALRGITDAGRFSPDAPHADRPHEIFAEDFRALFGDPLANYSGTIENASLCMPQAVSGLDAFMLHLAGVVVPQRRLEAFPNPGRGAVNFRRVGGTASPVDVFDLAGRRIASVEPVATAGSWTWRWSGADADGRRVAPGVLLARIRGDVGPALRIVVAR